MEKRETILNNIHVLYDSLFEQEKKIANFVMQYPEAVVNMTISELAEACTTSVASVTRFCKKVHSDGFHHLKIQLAQEIVENQPEMPVSYDISVDEIGQSLQNILANKIEELKTTVNLLDPEMVGEILKAIKAADLIQFVAVGNTIPAALDGAFKFSSIGLKAVSGTIWETQVAFSLSLKPGDVLIAISNSGESKQVVKMCQEATARGVTTVGITNNPSSRVAQNCVYHIQTATREKLFLNEFYFSRISAMTIIEILYLFMTVGNDDTYSKLSHFEGMIADEKL